jgi:hypothetical protein
MTSDSSSTGGNKSSPERTELIREMKALRSEVALVMLS